MRIMRFTKCLSGVVAVGFMSLAAVAAHAGVSDEIVMAGAACQPRSSQDRDDVLALVDGVFNTNTTSPAFVLCPIMRLNSSTVPNPTSRLIATVRASLPEPNVAAVSCLLNRHAARGEQLARDERSANSLGRINLAVDLDANSKGDYFVMQCRLPSDGGVISFSYEFQ
jgi:hypothetical protein